MCPYAPSMHFSAAASPWPIRLPSTQRSAPCGGAPRCGRWSSPSGSSSPSPWSPPSTPMSTGSPSRCHPPPSVVSQEPGGRGGGRCVRHLSQIYPFPSQKIGRPSTCSQESRLTEASTNREANFPGLTKLRYNSIVIKLQEGGQTVADATSALVREANSLLPCSGGGAGNPPLHCGPCHAARAPPLVPPRPAARVLPGVRGGDPDVGVAGAPPGLDPPPRLRRPLQGPAEASHGRKCETAAPIVVTQVKLLKRRTFITIAQCSREGRASPSMTHV